MWRLQWRDGEIISASHFVGLEDWVLEQIRGSQLTRPVCGLLPISMTMPGEKPRPAAPHFVQIGEGSPKLLHCGPLRALTRGGALLDIKDRIDVALDVGSLSGVSTTLYLIVGDPVVAQRPDSQPAEVKAEGPVRVLPPLRLSTRPSEHEDRLPVAMARLDGGKVVLDDAHVPPCAVVDGHPRVAGEVEAWGELLTQLTDTAMKHIARLHDDPEAAREKEVSRFVWGVCKPVAYLIAERPLMAERFFRTLGLLAIDLLKILRALERDVEDEHGADAIASALAGFDGSVVADLAPTLTHAADLRGRIHRAARFPEPRQSVISLSRAPTRTRDEKNDRWTTRLPLAEPLGKAVRANTRILVALSFKTSQKELEVRVHPKLKWSNIGADYIKYTRHDMETYGLESGRFSAYFVYLPTDESSLQANEIVIHSTAEPIVGEQSSVEVKVVGDA